MNHVGYDRVLVDPGFDDDYSSIIIMDVWRLCRFE